MARPKGKLAQLQNQFVRVRIVDMNSVDIGLFDFDFDATFFCFAMNHEEQIYLRFGARGDESPTEHMSIASFEHALQSALALHGDWQKGKLPRRERPKPKITNSYPPIQKLVNKGECVHCHHVANERSAERIHRKGFDAKKEVWIYPETIRLGLEFDLTRGLLLKNVSGVAKKAGLQVGERIVSVQSAAVHTYADLQQELHYLPTDTKTVELTLATESKKRRSITLPLPDHWRVTDINTRNIGHRLEPFPGFWAKTLTAAQKRSKKLDPKGFASEVTKFWVNTPGRQAGMKVGDIVYDVEGVTKSPLAHNAMIYIRLHHRAGERIKLKALRGTKQVEFEFRLKRRPW